MPDGEDEAYTAFDLHMDAWRLRTVIDRVHEDSVRQVGDMLPKDFDKDHHRLLVGKLLAAMHKVMQDERAAGRTMSDAERLAEVRRLVNLR